PVLHRRARAPGRRARAGLGARLGRRAAPPPRAHGVDRRRRPRPGAPRGPARRARGGRRRTMSTPSPVEVEQPVDDTTADPDVPWGVIVWNDPITLMACVTYVFQKVFGYTREKAERLMMEVHVDGRPG